MTIDLYTSPGCPDCLALKTWLVAHHIAWHEHDLSQTPVADEAKARYGVRVAPITVIGDVVLYGIFEEQRTRLRQILAIAD
ncbi:MAG: glutaredoxin family protein [Acidiferrobacter sp.]